MVKFRTYFLYKESLYWQIFKYICCGGITVLVDQIIYYTLGLHILPIFQHTDPIVEYLGIQATYVSKSISDNNFIIVKIICWLIANTAAYLLNIRFVFEQGRHKNITEVILFFGFALLQFIFIALSISLIRLGWEVTYANYSMLLLGAITNYLIRKFVIFQR